MPSTRPGHSCSAMRMGMRSGSTPRHFEAFGITRDTEDPEGGKIERDPETGELWGTLHEETAMNLITNQWPAYSDDDISQGILYAQDHYHSLGITALQDAMVKLDGRSETRSLLGLQDAQRAGQIEPPGLCRAPLGCRKGHGPNSGVQEGAPRSLEGSVCGSTWSNSGPTVSWKPTPR